MTRDSESFVLGAEESQRVFASPWEAHAFALTLRLHEQGQFEWSEWSQYLAEAVAVASSSDQSPDSDSYYIAWLNALEKLLTDKGIIDSSELLAKRFDVQQHADH